MKKERYPLRAALDQRAAAKEEKRRGLGLAVREAERERAALDAKAQTKKKLDEDRAKRAAHLYDPDPSGLLAMTLVQKRSEELKHVDGRIAEAVRAIADQRDVLSRAEAAVEAARAVLVEADRELKAVEKHHEAWLQEGKKEAARDEQRQSEEIVLARYAAEAGGGERGSE